MRQFAESGWEADVGMIRPDETAGPAIERQLASKSYDCVVVGGGVRLPPRHLQLFEVVINAIRTVAPGTAIAFNTRPDDSALMLRPDGWRLEAEATLVGPVGLWRISLTLSILPAILLAALSSRPAAHYFCLMALQFEQHFSHHTSRPCSCADSEDYGCMSRRILAGVAAYRYATGFPWISQRRIIGFLPGMQLSLGSKTQHRPRVYA